MLRFTRTWVFEHPVLGQVGDSIEGCLAYYDSKGNLKWNPPLNYFRGRNGRKQLHSMTTTLYNMVLEALKKSKHLDKIDKPLESMSEVLQDEDLSVEQLD